VKKEMIKIRQSGSAIRRSKRQALYLKSLGLGKIGAERELVADNSVLKLIEKVRHMVKVVS
jgi:ribosomal protein L30